MKTNQYELVNTNNIRLEPEYPEINKLVKTCLNYISQKDYLISGNFIDLRNGLIYVSMVGMVATDEERENFIVLDSKNNFNYWIRENASIHAIHSIAKDIGSGISPNLVEELTQFSANNDIDVLEILRKIK